MAQNCYKKSLTDELLLLLLENNNSNLNILSDEDDDPGSWNNDSGDKVPDENAESIPMAPINRKVNAQVKNQALDLANLWMKLKLQFPMLHLLHQPRRMCARDVMHVLSVSPRSNLAVQYVFRSVSKLISTRKRDDDHNLVSNEVRKGVQNLAQG
ncbi:hypothetical protein FQA39_LY00879 [Lamprigera yunnana]|nr:hypothetical protein FQA39_LY00879 [Lamprigera yunnana]